MITTSRSSKHVKVGDIVEIFYEELNDVYIFNIHNIRLSDIANLKFYIAQPCNYIGNAMEKFCVIPAGSHLISAFCIKSNFLPIL